MSKKVTEQDLSKALAALQDLAKGHNSRGTATTKVESVVGQGGATQVYHTPSNSDPRSWAGSTEQDVPEDGNTDSISENGTDYEAQAKLMKSIASKLAKGQKLNDFEKAVVKAMDEEEEKTSKAFPPKKDAKKDDDDGDEDDGDKKPNPFVKKSLENFAQENEEVSKGLDVSGFLAGWADVMHKSQNAMESRLEANILHAFASEAESNSQFQKSLADAIVLLGESVTAISQRVNQIESQPARGAKSVTNVQAINKGSYDGGNEANLSKSQICDELADMVVKGLASATDVVRFESTNEITPELHNKVRARIAGR